VPTRAVVIADTLAGSEAELVRELGFDRRLAVVSDRTTHAVLGERVEASLRGAFDVQSIVLSANPVADEATAEVVRVAARSVDALIAVGSGTINDLTKYAGALEGKPYAVFATAPSMNGYTSLTASITRRGHKLTLPAQAPTGAFFDLGIFAAAPKRMIRAGLGDSICRTTAQTDWLLSHLLFDTPYRLLPFTLLENDERQLLDAAADLMGGSVEALRVLTRTLVLSGFGTAIVGSSSPASQAEHLISHYLDMMSPLDRPSVLHGEQVGVTTLSAARLQDALLEEPPVLAPDRISERDVAEHFGPELAEHIWPEMCAKRLADAATDAVNQRIAENWSEISRRIGEIHLPAQRLEAVLLATGAPVRPEEIHCERALYDAAVLHAREIRNRYTVLDLAVASERLHALMPTI
jgi:glycerol-1-phosphate dehydrogenase [NAD(P)+]